MNLAGNTIVAREQSMSEFTGLYFLKLKKEEQISLTCHHSIMDMFSKCAGNTGWGL